MESSAIESSGHMCPGWCWVGGEVGLEEGRLSLTSCPVLRLYPAALGVRYVK